MTTENAIQSQEKKMLEERKRAILAELAQIAAQEGTTTRKLVSGVVKGQTAEEQLAERVKAAESTLSDARETLKKYTEKAAQYARYKRALLDAVKFLENDLVSVKAGNVKGDRPWAAHVTPEAMADHAAGVEKKSRKVKTVEVIAETVVDTTPEVIPA